MKYTAENIRFRTVVESPFGSNWVEWYDFIKESVSLTVVVRTASPSLLIDRYPPGVWFSRCSGFFTTAYQEFDRQRRKKYNLPRKYRLVKLRTS